MPTTPSPRTLKQRLRAIPLLGDVLAWANALLHLASLRQSHARLQARLDALAPPAAVAAADLDRFYVDFEDRFRGSREDIKGRLRVYLPRLAHLAGRDAATDAAPLAIDVGCGRGEWLELMAEHGIPAMGIDMNLAMVTACRERGLAAQCDDAIAFLRKQPPGSLALVTGFHIIEHLPFDTLIALFDAALHALRPDGAIIFETPNPENLRVGACSFYTDPTHIHPIVPDVAAFMARQRGFADTEILRLHPHAPAEFLAGDDPAASLLNQTLLGARDFAVLAWKVRRP